MDFRHLVDSIPALVYINQMQDVTDPTSAVCVYCNKSALEFIGATQEEITALGFQLYAQVCHPDDFRLVADATAKNASSDAGSQYCALVRQRPLNGEYRWFIGWSQVFRMKNGHPWQFLNIAVDITKQIATDPLVLEVLKENYRLKNKSLINTLGKREKEIIRLIANGLADQEIAAQLFISIKTAKTHRHNILEKLNLNKSADLVRFAVENGLN